MSLHFLQGVSGDARQADSRNEGLGKYREWETRWGQRNQLQDMVARSVLFHSCVPIREVKVRAGELCSGALPLAAPEDVADRLLCHPDTHAVGASFGNISLSTAWGSTAQLKCHPCKVLHAFTTLLAGTTKAGF